MTGFFEKLFGSSKKDIGIAQPISQEKKQKSSFDIDFTLKKATSIKKEKGFKEAITFLINGIEKFELNDEELSSLLFKMMPYMKSSKMNAKEIIDYIEPLIENEMKSDSLKFDLYLALSSVLKGIGELGWATTYCGASYSFIKQSENNYYYQLASYSDCMAEICLLKSKNDKEELIDYLFYYLERIAYEHLWKIKSGFRRADLSQYFFLKNEIQMLIDKSYDKNEGLNLFYRDKKFINAISKLQIEKYLDTILIELKEFLFNDLLEKVGWSEGKLVERRRKFDKFMREQDFDSFDITKHNKEQIKHLIGDYISEQNRTILRDEYFS